MSDSKQSPEELYWAIIDRNIGFLGREGQQKLKDSKVAIFGVGGFGGIVAQVLARAGVGKIAIVDFDKFDVSNQNRQTFAFCSTKGENKADATARFLKDINPGIEVTAYHAITEASLDEMLDGTTVAVHCVDRANARAIVARAANARKIPHVEGWSLPYMNVLVYTPDTVTWEDMYNSPTRGMSVAEIAAMGDADIRKMTAQIIMSFAHLDGILGFVSPEELQKMMATGKYASFAPMVWMESVYMASETMKVILGWGELALAPHWRIFDPFRHRTM